MPTSIKGGGGGKKLDLTATVADVLKGKTFSADGKTVQTGTMATMNGSTITPGTSKQTIACSGKKMTSNIVVAGDVNLDPSNIKANVTIFGKKGTYGVPDLDLVKGNSYSVVYGDYMSCTNNGNGSLTLASISLSRSMGFSYIFKKDTVIDVTKYYKIEASVTITRASLKNYVPLAGNGPFIRIQLCTDASTQSTVSDTLVATASYDYRDLTSSDGTFTSTLKLDVDALSGNLYLVLYGNDTTNSYGTPSLTVKINSIKAIGMKS